MYGDLAKVKELLTADEVDNRDTVRGRWRRRHTSPRPSPRPSASLAPR